MRKAASAAIVPILLMFGLFVSGSFKAAAQAAQVTTVPSVDLKRYSGKWFEIARYPNKFQKDCVGNTTAEYVLNTDETLQVTNRCLKKDGKVSEATGKGKVEDTTTRAKLAVRFAPAVLSFLPMVWGDYWIIDLDSNYQYSVVGDPERKYLWILSRTPNMDDAIYQQILRKVEKMGYQPNKLMKTPQDVENIKGVNVVKQ